MDIVKSILFATLMFLAFASHADPDRILATSAVLEIQHNVTDSFQVSGNCGMCKKKIETAVKDLDGVLSVSWDVNSKMLSITYNPHRISLTQVKQKIADSGYDTDTIKAKDADYNGLPGCCQYERE